MLAKICGFTHIDNFQELINYTTKTSQELPDIIGLNFIPGSSREVPDIETAQQLADIAHENGMKVAGLFQDQSASDIKKITQKLSLDYIQLHGAEDPKFAAGFDIPIIKSFDVDFHRTADELIQLIQPYLESTQYFLLDRPKDLDTENPLKPDQVNPVIEAYPERIFLAGRLTPENLPDVLEKITGKLAGTDVASSVESAPGIKNPRKTAAFVAASHA